MADVDANERDDGAMGGVNCNLLSIATAHWAEKAIEHASIRYLENVTPKTVRYLIS